MTLMWCSFGLQPMILRAYGTARTLHRRDADFAELNAMFPETIGARQVYDMTVEMMQTSCGYAVPRMDFAAERDTLKRWTEDKGADALPDYWREKNLRTLDGAPTGLFDDA